MTQDQIDYLKTRLSYDPKTGEFRWKFWKQGPNFWNARYAHKLAGSPAKYYHIFVDTKKYLAHRVAFMFVNGPIPKGMLIDHIDNQPLNNCLNNLRLATHGQNNLNKRRSSLNRAGVKNVRKRASRWQVKLVFEGRQHYFGSYSTIEEAASVADRERKRLHGAFARAA